MKREVTSPGPPPAPASPPLSAPSQRLQSRVSTTSDGLSYFSRAASLTPEEVASCGASLILKPSPSDPKRDPTNRAEAMLDDEKGWSEAERAELDNHTNNGSFQLIDRSEFEAEARHRRLVKLVWVYKRKRDGRLKARLCVQGCTQQPGIDYDQTHCATMRGTSLRMLSSLAGQHGLLMRRWDFVSAYLQGDLEDGEVLYCSSPPGPYGTTGADDRPRVWRVQKPVYGMAQAGRRWQRSLFAWLTEFGLTASVSAPCVFTMRRTVATPAGPRDSDDDCPRPKSRPAG